MLVYFDASGQKRIDFFIRRSDIMDYVLESVMLKSFKDAGRNCCLSSATSDLSLYIHICPTMHIVIYPKNTIWTMNISAAFVLTE